LIGLTELVLYQAVSFYYYSTHLLLMSKIL